MAGHAPAQIDRADRAGASGRAADLATDTSAAPLPGGLPAWERLVAKTTHYTFYAFMLLVPLSGWITTSAGGRPLNCFFLFDVPKFAVSKGDAIVGISGEAHKILGYLWIASRALHVGAALRHHFILKDDVLRRMLG